MTFCALEKHETEKFAFRVPEVPGACRLNVNEEVGRFVLESGSRSEGRSNFGRSSLREDAIRIETVTSSIGE